MVLETLAVLFVLSTPPEPRQAPSLPPTEVFARASRSVLELRVLDAQGQPSAMGSAVVVAPDLVATNAHVIKDAAKVLALKGDRRWPATIVHVDRDRDLAFLRIPSLNLPVPHFRRTGELAIGTKVYAIGSPRGLEATLSEGLVAGIRREGDGSIIQISAPISPGSSGGGVFDDRARLIGLSTLFLNDSQNLNFAIPSDWILEALVRPHLPPRAASAKRSLAATDSAAPLERSGLAPLPATLALGRCMGALNAHLVQRGEMTSGASMWLLATKGSIMLEQTARGRPVPAEVAETVGRTSDLFACQEANVPAWKLRQFLTFADGHFSRDTLDSAWLCAGTFTHLLPAIEAQAQSDVEHLGFVIGHRWGEAYANLSYLLDVPLGGAPETIGERMTAAGARIAALPEPVRNATIRRGLRACDQLEVPVSELLTFEGYRFSDRGALLPPSPKPVSPAQQRWIEVMGEEVFRQAGLDRVDDQVLAIIEETLNDASARDTKDGRLGDLARSRLRAEGWTELKVLGWKTVKQTELLVIEGPNGPLVTQDVQRLQRDRIPLGFTWGKLRGSNRLTEIMDPEGRTYRFNNVSWIELK